MAMRPRLAIAPALFEIRLRLPPGPAVVLLTGTLSLLPGTLSVRLDGDTLCLHALDGRLPVEPEVRAAEMRIARLFGVRLWLLWSAWRSLATPDLNRAVAMFIVFGLLMALAWARLGAPDIALAEAAIGAGLTGALLLDALGALRSRRGQDKGGT